MKKNTIISVVTKYLIPLVLFFLLETISHGNELLPFIFVVLYLIFIFRNTKNRKVEIILFSLAFVLGLIIEVGMTQFGRLQFWEGTFFAIPVWLPFAWGLGSVIFYRLGKEFEQIIK